MIFPSPNFPALFTQSETELRRFDRDLIAALSGFTQNLKGMLDRGLRIEDNLDARVVEFTTDAAPDTEQAVPHTLRRIPTHFILSSIDKGGVVYKGPTAFTNTNVYVKCTAASATVKLILL